MKFKVGDCIASSFSNGIFYEKILEIDEEEGYYKVLDLKTGAVSIVYAYTIDELGSTRFITDEEKVELL